MRIAPWCLLQQEAARQALIATEHALNCWTPGTHHEMCCSAECAHNNLSLKLEVSFYLCHTLNCMQSAFALRKRISRRDVHSPISLGKPTAVHAVTPLQGSSPLRAVPRPIRESCPCRLHYCILHVVSHSLTKGVVCSPPANNVILSECAQRCIHHAGTANSITVDHNFRRAIAQPLRGPALTFLASAVVGPTEVNAREISKPSHSGGLSADHVSVQNATRRRRLHDELHSAQCGPVGMLTWKELDRLTGQVIQS